MKKELLQFYTIHKNDLKEIAKNKGISLNALMSIIVDEFLKKN